MNSLTAFSLASLVEAHDAEVRRVLARRLGCVDTAADIIQEAYRRLAEGELWRQAENPRALLYRIALNLATDHERRSKTRDRYCTDDAGIEEVPSVTAQPDEVLEARERLDRLFEAVQALPPKCREVFILRKFEELGHEDIARRLGIGRNTVEKHLRNALDQLRARLDG